MYLGKNKCFYGRLIWSKYFALCTYVDAYIGYRYNEAKF